jgi:hypothetical protein
MLRQESFDEDVAADYGFNWINEIKEWQINFISGQTKMGKIFVSFLNKIQQSFIVSVLAHRHSLLQHCFIDIILCRYEI